MWRCWTALLPGQQQSSLELHAGTGVWPSAQRSGHVDTQLWCGHISHWRSAPFPASSLVALSVSFCLRFSLSEDEVFLSQVLSVNLCISLILTCDVATDRTEGRPPFLLLRLSLCLCLFVSRVLSIFVSVWYSPVMWPPIALRVGPLSCFFACLSVFLSEVLSVCLCICLSVHLCLLFSLLPSTRHSSPPKR